MVGLCIATLDSVLKIGFLITMHSSEIRGLHSTKCSSDTLQNLLYFMYKKTHVYVVFFVFHFVQLYIFTPGQSISGRLL